MSEYLKINSFETHVSNIYEKGFNYKSAEENEKYYDVSSKYNNITVGDTSELPSISKPVYVNDSTRMIVICDSFAESFSKIPSKKSYLYPLDCLDYDISTQDNTQSSYFLNGYSSSNWSHSVKNDISDKIQFQVYNIFDPDIYSVSQIYNKDTNANGDFVGGSPYFSFEGCSSFSAPIDNYIFYTSSSSKWKDSVQSKYSYAYTFKDLNSNICNSEEGFVIIGEECTFNEQYVYFDKEISVPTTGKYIFSFYSKSDNNVKICQPIVSENLTFSMSDFIELSDAWTRVSKEVNLVEDTTYHVGIKIPCSIDNTDNFTNNSIIYFCGILLTKVNSNYDLPIYVPQAIKKAENDTVIKSHNIIALNCNNCNPNNMFTTKSIIYIRKVLSRKIFDTFGNIVYGFDGNNFIVNGNIIDSNSSYNHYSETEFVKVTYDADSNKFIYESQLNSPESYHKYEVQLSDDFEFNSTIILANCKKSDGTIEQKTCNLALGASLLSGKIETYFSLYRNLIALSDSSHMSLNTMLNPDIKINYYQNSLKMISSLFIEDL